MTDTLNLDDALRYAAHHRDETLADLIELSKIPSISALPAHAVDVRAAAEWCADRLRALGMTVEIVEGRVHPVVLAEWMGRPGAPTLGIYNHFDVQPPDPVDLWTSPPFEPVVRNGQLFARGVADDKGALIAGIKAAEAMFAAGGPPINLRFFYEGEEEITGVSLGEVLRERADALACDYLFIGDGEFDRPGVASILTGLRGVLQCQIEVRGAAVDLHSGLYGGVAPNALNSLTHILSGLKGPDGRVTVPGFYDDVRVPTPAERSQWPTNVDEDALRREVGSVALEGEAEFGLLERLWTRPTLDVHGIIGGYTDEGTKTVIPARAVAKLSMRLVPDQDPERLLSAFTKRVRELATPGVEVTVTGLGQSRAALFGVDHGGVAAAQEAFNASFGSPATLKRMGASIPVAADFQDALATKMIVSGFSLPGDNFHSPDEHFALGQLHGGVDMIVRFAYGLAERASGAGQ
jgi:acetylornithine deacetylase/succinyl-diaminopimelate desuccinylase-like protein